MVANSTWWKSWRLVTEGAIASAANFSIRAEIHLLCLHPRISAVCRLLPLCTARQDSIQDFDWWHHRNWLSEWIDRAGEVFIKSINSLWVWMASCSFMSQCAHWCRLLTKHFNWCSTGQHLQCIGSNFLLIASGTSGQVCEPHPCHAPNHASWLRDIEMVPQPSLIRHKTERNR